ncbi:hypothetical protein H1C71_036433 [Ictidomys tridecemlineatus]|nr:hypothetical protein H1C71_036433 [Ictidomys tridecemlineatus]
MGSGTILLYSSIHLAPLVPASEEQRSNTVESLKERRSEPAAAPWSDPLPHVASSARTTGPVFDIFDFVDMEFQLPPSKSPGLEKRGDTGLPSEIPSLKDVHMTSLPLGQNHGPGCGTS